MVGGNGGIPVQSCWAKAGCRYRGLVRILTWLYWPWGWMGSARGVVVVAGAGLSMSMSAAGRRAVGVLGSVRDMSV